MCTLVWWVCTWVWWVCTWLWWVCTWVWWVCTIVWWVCTWVWWLCACVGNDRVKYFILTQPFPICINHYLMMLYLASGILSHFENIITCSSCVCMWSVSSCCSSSLMLKPYLYRWEDNSFDRNPLLNSLCVLPATASICVHNVAAQ